jgi:hypothetical protein
LRFKAQPKEPIVSIDGSLVKTGTKHFIGMDTGRYINEGSGFF